MNKNLTESSLEFNGKSIFCREGDITASQASAIVNAANNHLWMGAGVAGTIKSKGGQEIETEAIRKGPIQIGQVVVTGAGRMNAKYVIHAAVMGQDLRTNAGHIRNAAVNSLKQAEFMHLESLDFPALGTGVGGFPMDECARIMLTETLLFLKGSKHIKTVGFVLSGPDSHRAFCEALQKVAELI